MEIFIVTPTGGELVLTLDQDLEPTIRDLKALIREQIGVNEELQHLVINGKPLQDDYQAGECLRDGATLWLSLKMKGGSGDDDEEEEEASPEEKFQIASYFITQAPPGEVDFIVSDVTKLVNDATILDEKNLGLIMKKHNEDNFVLADASGKLAMFSSYGDMGDGKYFDPIGNRVVKADFKESKLTPTSDSPPETKYENYRKAVMDAAKKYVETAYNHKTPPRVTKKVGVAAFANEEGDINICISAVNLKIIASFWSGGWNSRYTLNVSSKGKAKISGMIKARVHCFEDGNVQLVSKMDSVDVEVTVDDPSATAKALMSGIEKIESDYQASMEEMYIHLAQSAFKKMRRILPVNQKKMDWRMAAHSVATQIHS